MKKSKLLKVVSLVLTIFIVLTLLVACGGTNEKKATPQENSKDSTDEKTTQKEVTIRLLTRYAGADPQTPYLKEMIEEFQKLHPNVKFQDDSIAEEAAYTNKLKTDIATGNLANMVQMYGSAPLAEYAKNGILMDISPLLEDKEWANGFIDEKFEYYNLDKYGVKGIYGIPFGYYPEVMYYNTELFKKAGITKEPETMEELYDAIDKLKAAGIIPWGVGAKDTWRAGHIHNNLVYRTAGVNKLKDIGARSAKWTDFEVVESLQVLKDLKAKGAFEQNFEGIDFETEKAGFFSGKYAMTLNGAWFVQDILTQPAEVQSKIDFFPFPYFKDKPQFKGDSVLFTNGHVFNGKLTGYEKEITIEWAKFFHGKHAQEVRTIKYRMPPARKDVDLKGAELPKLFKDIVDYMGTVSNPGGDYFDYDPIPSMIDVSRNNIIGMLLGNTAQEAAKEIQAEIDRNAK
ncbi:MAG: raffinose/stachyose/melibiose transport system substrate-binding protein [Petroclostridium sp.]|jgi:raffinose/stachyose/melibiose transport system substrate-binding protein|nr:msmE 18 [Clostridia bacterium]MDK2811323.1 raffinose/stachyose/melibiose transport system substrate-binding protein [Petroclostridium sp.]